MQVTAQHAKEAHGFDSIPAELVPAVQAASKDV